MIPAVTVCIPAHRSAPFIAHTLVSVRAQTFDDFAVEIAIEPADGDDTEAACAPFLADGRFRIVRNAETLGWPGNIAAMLGRVTTDRYVILPHDDAWHPDFLASLVAALERRPDASVAFGDSYLFEAQAGIRTFSLPDGALAERLLGFFLAGADGFPWRGLTRSAALDRPFPTNEYDGFAVECEWSLHLLRRGMALRVPEALYLKRARSDPGSVSTGWRTTMPETRLRAALEHHRRRMLDAVAATTLPDGQRRSVESAAEAAMLQRWVAFSAGRFAFGDEQRRRGLELLRTLRGDATDTGRRILGRTLLSIGRYERERGHRELAHRLLLEASAAAPSDWEVALLLGWSHLGASDPLAALAQLYRATRLAPMSVGLRELAAACAAAIDRRAAPEADPAAALRGAGVDGSAAG
jgi:glycosyl transferase family 2